VNVNTHTQPIAGASTRTCVEMGPMMPQHMDCMKEKAQYMVST